ncbi:MAG: exosortase E/protease, VPEID-CTERM system [Deltaproteobacteria bacterium]|jgi:exosortase E/protease (VPEID-CTERM system)
MDGRVRAAVGVGILTLEGFIVSLAYDLYGLLEVNGLLRFRLLVVLPVVVVAAYAVMRERADAAEVEGRTDLRWLGVHLLAYAAFFGLSSRVTAAPFTAGPAEVTLWILAGVATAASIPLALFSPASLRKFLVGERATLLVAGGVGGVAFVAAVLTEAAWEVLATDTLLAAHTMLEVFGVDAWLDEPARILGAGDFSVMIDRTCSGSEGLGLLSTLSIAYLVARRDALRLNVAWLLLPAAVALALLGNVLRIAVLMGIGANGAPELAVAGFHSKAGWLLACAIALALVHGSERWLTRSASGPLVDRPTLVYLGPLIVTLAAQLVFGLFVVDFDRLYAVQVVLVGAATAWALRHRPLQRPGWVVSVFVGIAVFAVWYLLAEPAAPEVVAARRTALDAMTPTTRILWIAARLVGSVLVVPIVEELAFRGYLLRRIISVDFEGVPLNSFAPLAWGISSVAFGALHSSFVAGTVAGLAFAGVAAYRGRLVDAIVAHAVANLGVAIAVLGGDAWWLWS